MSVPFERKMRGLADEIRQLAGAVANHGWASTGEQIVGDPGKIAESRPVLMKDFQRALRLALKLGCDRAWLPAPTPGADEGGYPWLTYEQAGGRRRFAVACEESRYRWHSIDERGEGRGEARFLALFPESEPQAAREVAQALEACLRAEGGEN